MQHDAVKLDQPHDATIQTDTDRPVGASADDVETRRDDFEVKCAEAQELLEEELDVMQAIFGDDVAVERDEARKTACVNIAVRLLALQGDAGIEEEEDVSDLRRSMVLKLDLPALYPFSLPQVSLESRGAVPHQTSEALYLEVLGLASEKLGEPMMYDLFGVVQAFLEDFICRKAAELSKSSAGWLSDLGMWALHNLRDAPETAENCEEASVDKAVECEGEELAGVSVPVASEYVALHDVFALLPENMAVLKIEDILREDHQERFELLRQNLIKAIKNENDERCKPRIVFHGTSAANVGSIIRTGLCVPGNRGVGVANGQALGKGIYVAHDASYSLNYCRSSADGHYRLFVCALLPKNTGRKAFVYDDGNVSVVDSEDQLLPLYVIHFDVVYGHASDSSYLVMTKAGTFLTMSGHDMVEGGFTNRLKQENDGLHEEIKRAAREQSLANASHYFDLKKYRVLEVAEVDDDDDMTAYWETKASAHVVEDGAVLEALDKEGGCQTGDYQEERFRSNQLVTRFEWEQEAREREDRARLAASARAKAKQHQRALARRSAAKESISRAVARRRKQKERKKPMDETGCNQ
ncbi:Poly ADP-ribose polymerase 6 [Durusdinium trenchii]|uniref:Poly ADP-ribose polymerase 6 n=1 Tax=Durusdinium trenchii TaxID=1381693 RepID=A0ABP0RQG1_9DINO